MTGPVQVLVVGFDQPEFSGEVLTEFTRLQEAGIVRLVDLLVVARADDGTFESVSAPTQPRAGLGVLAAALFTQSADPRLDGTQPEEASSTEFPVWSLADAVPAGSLAAVALIEHLWAVPLTAAIRRAGGTPLEETWLAPADLERLEDLIATRQQQLGEFVP